MDSLGAFVLGAIALEAVVHILGNIWDEEARADWSINALAYYVIPIVALFVADGDSITSGLGLDFDVDALGTVITGLAAGRVAMWVGSFYTKTAG